MNAGADFLLICWRSSTSSAFWMVRDNGLKSYRRRSFAAFPDRVPDHFGIVERIQTTTIKLLIDLHCIDMRGRSGGIPGASELRNAEFACATVPTRPERQVMLARSAQAIVVKLHKLYSRNLGFRSIASVDRENKVAGGAMGYRRQVDRFRQTRRSADAPARA
jgi:carboxylate-amine ligase